jgi:hypothetical protein
MLAGARYGTAKARNTTAPTRQTAVTARVMRPGRVYFAISPQAILSPAFPVGSVFRSSALA